MAGQSAVPRPLLLRRSLSAHFSSVFGEVSLIAFVQFEMRICYVSILMQNTSMVSFDGGSASKVDDVTA